MSTPLYELSVDLSYANYTKWKEFDGGELGFVTFDHGDGKYHYKKFKLSGLKENSKNFTINFFGDEKARISDADKFIVLLAPISKAHGLKTVKTEKDKGKEECSVDLNLEGVSSLAECLLDILPLLDTIDGPVPFSLKSHICRKFFNFGSVNLFERYKKELDLKLQRSVTYAGKPPTPGLKEEAFFALVSYAKNTGHPGLLLHLANKLEEIGFVERAALVRIQAITQPKLPKGFLSLGKEDDEADRKTQSEVAYQETPEFQVAKALFEATVKFPAAQLELMLKQGIVPNTLTATESPLSSTLTKIASPITVPLIAVSSVVSSTVSSAVSMVSSAFTSTLATAKAETAAKTAERRTILGIIYGLLIDLKKALENEGCKESLKKLDDLLIACLQERCGQSDLTKDICLQSPSLLHLTDYCAALNNRIKTLTDKLETQQKILEGNQGQQTVAAENDALKSQNSELTQETQAQATKLENLQMQLYKLQQASNQQTTTVGGGGLTTTSSSAALSSSTSSASSTSPSPPIVTAATMQAASSASNAAMSSSDASSSNSSRI